MISIVGLGPDRLENISVSALAALKSGADVYLRTIKHPVAQQLAAEGIEFDTFDSVYETAESFDEVYSRISDTLIAKAQGGADIVYAVPGHPLIGERSVGLLIKRAVSLGVEFNIEGSMSFIESCLEVLAVSIGRGLMVLDALEIDTLTPAPFLPALVYQVYSREIASIVKLRLMEFYDDEYEVMVVTGGAGKTEVQKMPLYQLDRREFDHLASVFIPVKENELPG